MSEYVRDGVRAMTSPAPNCQRDHMVWCLCRNQVVARSIRVVGSTCTWSLLVRQSAFQTDLSCSIHATCAKPPKLIKRKRLSEKQESPVRYRGGAPSIGPFGNGWGRPG